MEDNLNNFKNQLIYDEYGNCYHGYNAYINSDVWREKRKKRLEIDGYKCLICDSNEGLEVHHMTYANLGQEDIKNDLVTLCKPHHEWITRIQHYISSKQFIELQRVYAAVAEGVMKEIQRHYINDATKILCNIMYNLAKDNKRNGSISGNGNQAKFARFIQNHFDGRKIQKKGYLVNLDRLFKTAGNNTSGMYGKARKNNELPFEIDCIEVFLKEMENIKIPWVDATDDIASAGSNEDQRIT